MSFFHQECCIDLLEEVDYIKKVFKGLLQEEKKVG